MGRKKVKEKILNLCLACGEELDEQEDDELCKDCQPEYYTYKCVECGREFETDVLLNDDEAICSRCNGSDYFTNWEKTQRGTPGYEAGEKVEDNEDYLYSENDEEDDED